MRVLIVGAGPGGVATSLLFARRGFPVTPVERETDFERVFRGEGLMPAGVDAEPVEELGDRAVRVVPKTLFLARIVTASASPAPRERRPSGA